jgi:hypothetical protein
VSFRGAAGGEWRGIVDVLAVRKDTSQSSDRLLKSGGLFDVVLVQMKGGSARTPSAVDIQRLMAVAKRYRAREIVLFAWKRAEYCTFHKIVHGRAWAASSAREIFGSAQTF